MKKAVPRRFSPLARTIYHRFYRWKIRLICGCLGLWERLWSGDDQQELHIPPPLLRFRVGESVNRKLFLQVGKQSVLKLLSSLASHNLSLHDGDSVLDFGCGCGRSLIWLHKMHPSLRLFGTDTDQEAIKWCHRNLNFAQFSANNLTPPLMYPDSKFHLIYALSVFTHLDKTNGIAWIQELVRVLKPNGVLMFTAHGPEVWGNLEVEERRILKHSGFLFKRSSKLKGFHPDWYQTAYHSEAYVRSEFGRWIEILAYIPRGMGYQDVFLARRRCDGQNLHLE